MLTRRSGSLLLESQTLLGHLGDSGAQDPMCRLHSMLAVSVSQEAEEDIPKQKERTHFTVRLTEAKPVDKVKLIKEIKNYIQGINLVQVSSAPHGPLCPACSRYSDWPLLGQGFWGHHGPCF